MPPFSDYNINKQKKIAILFFISPWKNHHKIVVHPVSKSSLSVCMSDARINKAFHNRGGAYEYHGIA